MRTARTPTTGTPAVHHTPLRTFVTLVIATALVSAALIVTPPRLAVKIEQYISSLFASGGDEATALSTTMRLGATHGMLQSDTIVLRIEPPSAASRSIGPEYLRGAVYDRYGGRYWTTSAVGRTRKIAPAPRESNDGTSRMTLARSAPEGEDMRWFLPASACDLATSQSTVEIDGFGVVRRARGEDPRTITFRTTGCTPAPIAPPSAIDLDVPTEIAPALAPMAARWVEGAATPRAKLDAIKRELGRFEYSLSVPRNERLDPVVDFVTLHRAGHCELFASAMVLLARTQGIPARVVGGYHVSEVNPITGQLVVRERNAHAWVEAWIDGAWRGWDPTPASETFSRRGSTLEYLGDVFAGSIDRAAITLAQLGPLGVAAILASVLGLYFASGAAVRSIQRRLRARSAHALTRTPSPLPCFESLAGALAGAGLERAASEPLEIFARRIAKLDAPWAAAAAQALLDYAGLRYGDVGDARAIERALERAARAVRQHAT
jgi:transglutaminase-like putative cysteine protease